MNSDLESIIAAAIRAPSGENCQPWHFIVRNDNVAELHLLRERDQSFYSWGQRASYLADGAALENLIIAASDLGYRTDISYFPGQDPDHVATIQFIKDTDVRADPLASMIVKRVSNRNPYQKTSLTSEERKELLTIGKTNAGAFYLLEDPAAITTLARIGATNEEIMLGNKALHDFFFSHISWTKEEDDRKKVGFYIETLELPPPAKGMFKLFQHWSLMRLFNALGFNRIVGKQNATTYASAAAIGAFAIDTLEPIDFVKVGRAIERLWLKATALGLDLQPMTGVLYFHLKIAGGEGNVFSEQEHAQIEKAYSEACALLGTGNKKLVFMFRIGHGKPASAQAVRFPLSESVTIVE